MAAVAPNHLSERMRGIDHDQFSEPSSSGFTAVNGRVSPTAMSKSKPSSSNESPKGTGDEAPIRQNHHGDRREPEISHTPRRVEDQHPIPTEQPETFSGPSSGQHSTSQSPRKRKRSQSEEKDSANTQLGHSHDPLAESPPEQEIFTSNGNGIQNGHDEQFRDRREELEQTRMSPQDPYPRPPSRTMRMQEPDQGRYPPVRNEYMEAQVHHPERPYYTHNPDMSEVRLAEALQQENRNYAQMPPREQYGTPEEDDMRRQQYGEYSANRSSISGVDGDPRKRRKRVFSNRTKTGCMTCRRRKKKCDEGRPECNNCLRGGFVCEGYSMRTSWQKPTPSKGPVQIQSKTGPLDMNRPPSNQSYSANDMGPEYSGRSTAGPRPQYAPEGDRVKPIIVDEEREYGHSMPSPQTSHARSAYSKTPRPYPNNPPHLSKYQPENDRSMSIHEIPHEAPDSVNIYPPSSHRTTSSHHTSTHSSTPHHPQNAQPIAQAALQQSQYPSQRLSRSEVPEREKMLRGEHYLPYTPALMADREQCSAAVWRFNNTTNPAYVVSPEERLRLFKAIVNLQPTPEPSSDGRSSDLAHLPRGSMGPGVVVEAPFHCDYGYNITIGSNVVIGPDCRITDTCAVKIGNNCVFSPNVKLVCVTYPIDPAQRRKGKGRALGRDITIEDDSWIGSNVTILPGVRVGRGATVGAGSVIHKDVPPSCVVAGNPQKVIRGIDNTAESI